MSTSESMISDTVDSEILTCPITLDGKDVVALQLRREGHEPIAVGLFPDEARALAVRLIEDAYRIESVTEKEKS